MRFGIRGKVALLVMLATAASVLLVAEALTHRASKVLEDHELVDLGDEAALRSWEMIDKVEGLVDDMISMVFSPTFQEDVDSGEPREELASMARGLCTRHWDELLRIDLVTLGADGRDTRLVEEKARLTDDDLWFPSSEARARNNLIMSPIQRLRVTRTDLLEDETVTRSEPVIWAVMPLGRPEDTPPRNEPVYVRILITLHHGHSPRHLFALTTEEGEVLVRHDEIDPLENENDAVFERLRERPELAESNSSDAPGQPGERQKVLKLEREKNVRLASPYYFREAIPGEALGKAIDDLPREELEHFLQRLEVKLSDYGHIGGLQGGVEQLRLLSPDRKKLERLREGVVAALKERFGEAYDGLEWRDRVECETIHAWAVRLAIATVNDETEEPKEYLMQYAVFVEELASSIEYEMAALRTTSIFVAGAFGILGFFMTMHFIRPLEQMTQTAQKITETGGEGLYKKVAGLARRLDVKRRDEVGDIARALKRLFEELAAFQEDLEHRVDERTRELRRANTELEKANDKLETLSQEKDAFVAKVSHDLRQPLNAIFLQVEALKLSELEESQRRDVDRIHAHASRELNLVNDILEYQKIIMGAETLEKGEIDIHQLLEDLAEAHRPAAEDKGIAFAHHCDESLGVLEADDRRLRQVLGNLIGNAGKFTEEGSVTIAAHSREIEGRPWVEFTIADTGRGMTPEEQSRAFVPFVSNKKDNAGGTGLGLSISRELVTQMGGRIGFVSEYGKGTHFSILLPRDASPEHYGPREETATPEPASAPAGDTSGDDGRSLPREATVLVIDDEQKVRELLQGLLEAEGYQVLTAADGHSGLELADRHLPDVITLDVVMPGGKDGWNVLRELKETPRTREIPVIMVSVMAEQENGLALDVEDYLVKPIDVDRLTRAIQRITEQSPQRNLLLVDDEDESLDAMARILGETGWQTLRAHDGAEALDLLGKTRPAAIVLDLVMPGMDGFEFLRHLQAEEHLRSIPVIVMTGKDPSESEREFLRSCVGTVVRKGNRAPAQLIASIGERVRPRMDTA